MNNEVKARWIQALKSGNFQQGKNSLHYENKFCCLGVLCELAVENNVSSYERSVDSSYTYYDGGSTTPAARVLNWAELESITVETLIRMNDSYENSFETIANYIEENL